MKNRKSINIFIIVINVLFVFGLTFGEWQYINSSRNQTIKANKASFVATNESLGSMTSNYLVGESHLCRSWSNYINSTSLTIEEAIDFVDKSITDKDIIMAHIVNSDTKKGISTIGHTSNPDNKEVDYSDYFLSKVTYQDNSGIKASPQYTNPINAKPSIAFYTEIKLKNSTNPAQTDNAFLLRVVPISNLEDKWTFPSSFEHLDVAIIDNSSESNLGAYIFHHSAFRGTSFFEYYSYDNHLTDSALKALQQKMSTEDGTFIMKDSYKKELFVSYSQIPDPERHTKWTIITAIPTKDLTNVAIDWLTISIIGVGLGILFIIDLFILLILNKSLQDTAKVAESANKAKTDFLSTMSHDIRTPMNAIVGLTYIASKEEMNPEVTQDALKKITLASNHLLTLINDILDISKVESGRLTINPLSFSIVDTFENLVNISQPMVKAKNIDFNFITHNLTNEWLYADKLRLSQIFTNLISNALKYTENNGKVTVDIKEIESEQENHVKLIYQVADTGIGMSKDYIEKMYEPFTRATDSRINSIQGTGLGLAITKQMVDLMNGTIECESQVGKGTTFTVTIDLPIDEVANEEMSLSPMNVLVVDSNETLLKTSEETLSSLGVKVSTAMSSKDAINIVKDSKDEQFKVIILDMNSLAITKEIRKLDKEAIILVSSYDFSEIEKQAKDVGVNGFIGKPLFRSKVYQKINDLLNHGKSSTVNEEEDMNFPGVKILVVEDNDINWEIISTLLSMHGISCDRAENGKIAYELIREDEFESPYDLIFMDIQMPVMNGLEATKAIRKIDSEYARNAPIIAMSADAFSENVAECLQAGMNGHIAKPIDINLVLTEIRKIKK